jgi:AcrR family transcriptional regulator
MVEARRGASARVDSQDPVAAGTLIAGRSWTVTAPDGALERGPGLREMRKARTQRAIQEHAMRLFTERGYDATTVADVAAAAEVSSMTVFRYFPAKEDLVMADEYDPVIADWIQARPVGEPLVQRISAALAESAAGHSPDDRALLLARVRLGLSVPALRARMWDGQYRSQRYIVEALRGQDPTPATSLSYG